MKKIWIFSLLILLCVNAEAGFKWGSGFDQGDFEINTNSIVFSEKDSDPTVPLTNGLKLFAKDDGSGNTRLYYMDSGGTAVEVGSGAATGLVCTDCVALSTETSGAYVTDITAGTGLDTTETAAAAENNTVTVDFDSTEISTTTWGSGSDFVWTFDNATANNFTMSFSDSLLTTNFPIQFGGTGSSIVFEGATADDYEMTLTVTDPASSDKTITLPNVTGTVALTSSNVATATALAANGANCSAGSYPLGVDASGAVETCTTVLSGVSDQIYMRDNTGRTATFYMSPGVGGAASETNVDQIQVTRNGTVNSMYCTTNTDPNPGNWTATFRTGTVGSLSNTSSTCNIPLGSVACSDTANHPTFTAGQYFSVAMVAASSPASTAGTGCTIDVTYTS